MSDIRPIDANALKNDLITFFPDKCLEGITAKTLFKQILTDIDNAPTVDIIPKGEYEIACNVLLSLEQIVRKSDGWEDSAIEAIHNAVQTAIKCMHDRTQGKWIRKVDEVGFVSHICSKCGAEIEVEDCSDDKFCFNCGAKMKGGAE